MGVETVRLFSDWLVHLTKNHDLIIVLRKLLLLLSGPHFIFIYSLLFRRKKKKTKKGERKKKAKEKVKNWGGFDFCMNPNKRHHPRLMKN